MVPILAWAAIAMQQGRPEAIFGSDARFLEEHAGGFVLQAEGCGPVAVSPVLSGRVMTSAFARDEPGFGLVNRAAIEGPHESRGFRNFGGEDRLWLAPEGGPYALFFDAGAPQSLDRWRVPPAMDGAPRTVVARDAVSVTFRDSMALENARGVRFELAIERRIEALDRAAVAALLREELGDPVRVVAFRSTNTVRNGEIALPADGVIAPWVLGQFKPSATTEALLPFRGDEGAIKRDYFGEVPVERLRVALEAGGEAGVARMRADAQLVTKIGVSARGALGWIGAWDPKRGVLTLVHHTLPPPDAIVPDCDWRDPNPRALRGDVATSYNHGQEPRFFELESIGAALPRAPSAATTHVHTTIHLDGDPATLARIARRLLWAQL